MPTTISLSPWFRRFAPPLAALAVALVAVAWFVMPEPAGADVNTVDAPRRQAVSKPTCPALQAPAARVIRPERGAAGTVRIGMTLRQVSAALCERLVTTQRGTPGGRFEAVATRAGVRLAGARGRIDTIDISDAGDAARTWRMPNGVRIGSRSIVVPRSWPGAQRMCGREWWVWHGSQITARYGGGAAISSISITSVPPAGFAACA